MTTLGVLVEGSTEREFVTRLVKPHLHERSIFAKPIDLQGNVSLDRLKYHLPRALGEFRYVTTLIDYYGFKKKGTMTIEQLEAAIGEAANSQRFIPYVQKYEFESLLFSDAASLAQVMGQPNKRHLVEEVLAQAGSPELINDRYETCPSRRLEGLFPNFSKKFHGPEICIRSGLAQIRHSCQRFGQWLTRLEGLLE